MNSNHFLLWWSAIQLAGTDIEALPVWAVWILGLTTVVIIALIIYYIYLMLKD